MPFIEGGTFDSMIAKVPELLITMAFWLGYCNSFLNPIIYACSNGHFRRAFRRFLLCGKRQGRFPTMRTEDYTLSSRSSFRRVHSSCSVVKTRQGKQQETTPGGSTTVHGMAFWRQHDLTRIKQPDQTKRSGLEVNEITPAPNN
ncbi:Adra1bp [Branchiostoma belcheri]|nr:Adra1bp [Branchiostoma belcheri]